MWVSLACAPGIKSLERTRNFPEALIVKLQARISSKLIGYLDRQTAQCEHASQLVKPEGMMTKAGIVGLGGVLVSLAGALAACGVTQDGTEELGEQASALGYSRHPHGSRADKASCRNLCTVTYQGDEVVRYITVKEGGFSFEETRTVNLQSPGGGATTSTGIVKHGGQKVYSYTASAGPDGTGSVDVDWGHQVKGMDEAATQFSNGVLTGSVNGRNFEPFDIDENPASVVFVDGKPAPRGALPGNGMKKQLQRLEAEVNDVVEDCEVVTSLDETDPAQAIALRLAGNDPGHHSDTYSTGECDGCKATVIGGATVTCGLTCAFTFGIGCPVCIGAAAIAVPAGILACEQSGACCPQACGGGFPGTCCFGDEECLNRDDGLCCSPGMRACEGEACCRGDESCIDSGALKGSCCKDELVSGNNCCEEGEVPFGVNDCCASGKECGSVCCGGVEDTLSYCMNAGTSTCCSSFQKECNGVCCPQGQDCVSGLCVEVEHTCEQPCTDRGDCVGDSHLRCRTASGCCVYTPF